jgi:hypothetical protein
MSAPGLISEKQRAAFVAALEHNRWRSRDFEIQEDSFDPRRAEVEAALGEVGVRCLPTAAVKVYRVGAGTDWVDDFAADLESGHFGHP